MLVALLDLLQKSKNLQQDLLNSGRLVHGISVKTRLLPRYTVSVPVVAELTAKRGIKVPEPDGSNEPWNSKIESPVITASVKSVASAETCCEVEKALSNEVPWTRKFVAVDEPPSKSNFAPSAATEFAQ